MRWRPVLLIVVILFLLYGVFAITLGSLGMDIHWTGWR